MAGQQICLKWNSFQSNIVTSFESLWEEEGLVDVTLASDGQCIRAHKVILSACSPFFRKVFQSNPCQHPVIILQDVHFSELESLLCFVYKGEVNIEQENLPALLRAAETLQIRGLSGASEQVKEKMGVSTKKIITTPPLENLHDSPPPVKRQRSLQQSQSPPLPDTPLALTPTSRPIKSRHPSTSSVEPWEQPHHPFEPEFPPKVEMKDDSCSPSSHLMAAEEHVDDSTNGSLGTSLDLAQAQGKLSGSDITHMKGDADESGLDLLLPYQKLPYACLLPRAQVLATWAKARTLEQLACDLMKILFSTEERIICNVNGKMGKRQFNVHKIQLIRLTHNEISTFQGDLSYDPAQASKNFPYPPFPCPFCDRAYTSWGFRRRHIKAVHTQSPRLSCKWCFQILPSHSDWEEHVMSEHNLSASDAHNGLLILEEAHMVLQIPNPTRLDTFVSMIKKSNNSNSNNDIEKSSGSGPSQEPETADEAPKTGT